VVSGLRVGIGADAVRSGAELSESATVLMYMCSSGEAVSVWDRPEPGGSSITSKDICKDEQTITVGHGVHTACTRDGRLHNEAPHYSLGNCSLLYCTHNTPPNSTGRWEVGLPDVNSSSRN